jgi:hypothetical protein
MYWNTARLRIRPRNSDSKWKEVVKQSDDKKLKINESNQRRKTLQTLKRRFNPQYGRQFCYEENHSMAWGKPQQMEMTAEINSNLKYAI